MAGALAVAAVTRTPPWSGDIDNRVGKEIARRSVGIPFERR